MREIKFRAWDKKTKKMRVIESIGFGTFSTYTEGYPVINLLGRDCIKDKNILLHREQGQYEIMQYTGLKDKNGKEIYEGDIVEVDYLSNLQIKCEVIFENGCFKVKYFVDNGLSGRLSEPVSIWINDFNYVLSRIKVIGNIYENPELLEE